MQSREAGMTFIVKVVTRITLGFILLYGIYISLSGHIGPGGGFAGGVIVALSLVHVVLAFGKDAALRRLSSGFLRIAISAAALIFLVLLMYRVPIAENEIVLPLCETVIVGGGLFAIFIALVLLTKTSKDAE